MVELSPTFARSRPGFDGPTAIVDVVIPALNAESAVGRAVAAFHGAPWLGRVIVVDGGSGDETVRRATDAGASVIAAPRGRGPQLAAGAAAVTAPWVLFAHADTRFDAAAMAAAGRFTTDPANHRRVGYFPLAFDDASPMARVVAAGANLRARIVKLPYGDQGLLIEADLLREIGGWAEIPLMEDVELVRRVVRRLGRGALVALGGVAITSADRYRRDGWVKRVGRNLFCLTAHLLGASPTTIRRWYG